MQIYYTHYYCIVLCVPFLFVNIFFFFYSERARSIDFPKEKLSSVNEFSASFCLAPVRHMLLNKGTSRFRNLQ